MIRSIAASALFLMLLGGQIALADESSAPDCLAKCEGDFAQCTESATSNPDERETRTEECMNTKKLCVQDCQNLPQSTQEAPPSAPQDRPKNDIQPGQQEQPGQKENAPPEEQKDETLNGTIKVYKFK